MARTVPMIAPVHRALLLAAAAALGGCATTARTPPALPAEPTSATVGNVETLVPVVRYGRYALVEVGATAPQHDLMQQIVDVTMPGTDGATVGDALRYVLRRSGYRLCSDGAPIQPLLSWPLPAADLHLGPITLRDALQTLAGDAPAPIVAASDATPPAGASAPANKRSP
jgi:conjugative transfer region protein (TIGR03748 family)